MAHNGVAILARLPESFRAAGIYMAWQLADGLIADINSRAAVGIRNGVCWSLPPALQSDQWEVKVRRLRVGMHVDMLVTGEVKVRRAAVDFSTSFDGVDVTVTHKTDLSGGRCSDKLAFFGQFISTGAGIYSSIELIAIIKTRAFSHYGPILGCV